MRSELNIPHKAGRILNLVLLAFILIFLRVWYLGSVQGEHHKQQSRKPQRRSSIEKVDRATIRDRFNLPLAQNKIDYTVAVRYADIRDLPSYKWIIDADGKRQKVFIRGPYIAALASFLAKELELDPEEIEDIIYAKASLFPHTPFILKESLQESEYYRMRELQKDWIGLEVQKNSTRFYPQGKVASSIVGYMGAINSSEYLCIAREIKELEEYIKRREAGELVFLPPGHINPLQVRKRLHLLKEQAYTINDLVGKTGIEKQFDETLRGVHGKKTVEIDPKGHVLRELPGSKKGVSGQRIFLTLSSELQEFAESLLAQHEKVRDLKNKEGQRVPGLPWIKGGAAVAMNPKTGEILALASYPRLDPNDFIKTDDPVLKTKKQKSLNQWIENESYLGEIWEGKTPLTREVFAKNIGWVEEELPFSWSYFLSTILPPNSAVMKGLDLIGTVKQAYELQTHFDKVLERLDFKDPMAIMEALYPRSPHIPCKKKYSPDLLLFLQDKLRESQDDLQESLVMIHSFLSSIPHNEDKLLALDLTRLLFLKEAFSPSTLEKIGHLSLPLFFELSQSFNLIQDEIKENTRTLHHKIGFKAWREKHFKTFLKQKRKEEKEKKKQAKPYTEYLEKLEKALFKSFWNSCKYLFLDTAIYSSQRISLENYPELIPYLDALKKPLTNTLLVHARKLQQSFASLTPIEISECLKSLRSFEELDRPLYGKYRSLRNNKGVQLEKHLAAAFYPLAGFSYERSHAFRQPTPPGSVFKLVVAYEALKEKYHHLKDNLLGFHELNPLTLVDQLHQNSQSNAGKQLLGYTLDGQAIRRSYKGGILPRSHANIGKVDLTQAIEQSSNIYFSILAAEHIADPSLLEETTKNLGFGAKTGVDLQGEAAGMVPNDLCDNKTGLYTFAIGQHTLTVTPLQTALMLSALGNGGKIIKPQIVRLTAGKKQADNPLSLDSLSSYPFQEPLALIGIHFPLFTEPLTATYDPYIEENGAEVIRSLFLPPEIKAILFDGMNKVISGKKGTARHSIIQSLQRNPDESRDYLSLQGQLIGKTGTAEILYKPWLDAESTAQIHNHIWFGGLVFPEGSDPKDAEAELAIVVYLRFSLAGGKEAAPIAAQIAKKWREIQEKHGASSHFQKK